MWKVLAPTRERRRSPGWARLRRQERRRYTMRYVGEPARVRPAQMEKQLGSFHLKNQLVSAAAAERESGTPELPGQLVEMGRVPVAGGTWPLGIALHGSVHTRRRAQATWKTASGASSFHHGHGAGVCAVPDGSL